MKYLFNILLSALALVLLAIPLAAEEANAVKDLGVVEQALGSSTIAQADLVRQLAATIRAQEDLSGQLVDAARKAQGEEQALSGVTARIGKLTADNAEAELSLAKKRDALSLLLAGLQRLDRNPPPALVVAPDDVLKALRGAMIFGAVIPDLRQQTSELKAALGHVEALKAALANEKANAEQAIAALTASRGEIKRLLAEKVVLAEQNATQLKDERTKSEVLAARAKSLRELVAGLEAAKAEKLAEMAAKEQASLVAEAEAESLRRQALAASALVFSRGKGRLNYPLQGTIHRRFGDDNGLGGQLEGELLLAAKGAEVLSPVDGRIEFAGHFRSYDQLVIINPGEGYLVLLAGMSEITAYPGQSVRAGEPVGNMGERPTPLALAGDLTHLGAPVLYIEFRKKNRSIDPSPWWVAGRKEAMR